MSKLARVYEWLALRIIQDREASTKSEILLSLFVVIIFVITGWVGANVFDRTPSIPILYPAVIVVGLFAGWRVGMMITIGVMIIAVGCGLLTWSSAHMIFRPATIAEIVFTSCLLMVTVSITSGVQSATARLFENQGVEIERLYLLLEETDHRAKNNYQMAGILLDDAATVGQFDNAIERIAIAKRRLSAVALAYDHYGSRQRSERRYSVTHHLKGIVSTLSTGLVPSNVVIVFKEVEDIVLDQQHNLIIGLIVGEWITNAAKYAFRGSPGHINICLRHVDDELHIEVRDDGSIENVPIHQNVGSKLVRRLAGTVGARVEINSSNGVQCTMILPVVAV